MIIFVIIIYLFISIFTIMSCTNELSKGILISGAGIAGVGTAIDLDGLFPANAVQLFDEISVFNDGDRAAKVEWTNDETGNTDFFIVPHGGKAFTHKLNKGHITSTSLKIYSLTATAITGNITINVSKNRP